MSVGFTVWLTGLSGAGKTTIAQRLAQELEQRGRLVVAITLRDLTDASLKALDEFVHQAAAQLRRWK